MNSDPKLLLGQTQGLESQVSILQENEQILQKLTRKNTDIQNEFKLQISAKDAAICQLEEELNRLKTELSKLQELKQSQEREI